MAEVRIINSGRLISVLVLGGTLALALAACSTLDLNRDTLRGDGNVVTETRAVPDFESVVADNGVQVSLTVDPSATGDPLLSVTTDSNLQEFLITSVTDSTLTISTDRSGGVGPSGSFNVSGAVDVITEISVDNGAQVEVIGVLRDIRLSADNGAQLDGNRLETASATIHADNGARMSVCASDAVTGTVRNGAQLTVRCGGSYGGVQISDGGTVSSAP